MFINVIIILIGIGLIIWGLANVYYGYRFYRVSLLVVLGILGASIGLIFTRESPSFLQILIPGLLTLIFGLAAYYMRSVVLILAGGMILAIVVASAAFLLSLPETIAWILTIIGLIGGAILAYLFSKYTIYLVTAMWGASYAISGVTLIFYGRTFDALRALGSGALAGLVVWIALVGFGIFWQFKGQVKSKETDPIYQANELKFWQTSLLALMLGLGVVGILWIIRDVSPFLTLNRPTLDDLEELSLEGYERLLVLAPHNDDEALGAAGLMLKAVEEGIDVHVVFLTNGDGFTFSTIQEFETLFPSPQDYISLGKLRQDESIAAVGALGVVPDNVTFLGYPDGGTPALWYENWSVENPYKSEFTQTTQSPYENTYNPDSVYAGENLLGDLRDLMDEIQPDLIVYPHGNDVHADHWGFYAFSRLAVEVNRYLDKNFNPDTYAYLVHRPDFPYPEEFNPQESLLPPVPLFQIYPNWYRIDLNESQVVQKEASLEEYKSQIDLLWQLMSKFIRRNEVFTKHTIVPLPELAQGDPFNPNSWRDVNGKKIEPVQLDPTADILERALIPSADLKAFYLASTTPDEVVACAEIAAEPEVDVFYVLHLKGIGFEGIIDHAQDGQPSQSTARNFLERRYFSCSKFSLKELGDPVFIFAGAQTEETASAKPLDEMAWQMVEILQDK